MEQASPSLEDFDRLLAFLPLIVEINNDDILTWHGGQGAGDVQVFPHPEYAPGIFAFFMEAGRPCWNDFQYMNKEPGKMLENPACVREASLAEIKTRLTFCVRGERFSDGFWQTMIEEGKIRMLLERLAELRP